MPHDVQLPSSLRSARLLLRAATDDDADAFAEAVRESAESLCRFMSWPHRDYRPEEARGRFGVCNEQRARGTGFEYLVFEGDRFVGVAGLSQLNAVHPVANLGYWVRTSCTGRGHASEATRTLAAAAIAAGLVRLEIVAAVSNVASQRVAEKAGATREAVLRSRIVLRGVVHDAALFSIVRGDV